MPEKKHNFTGTEIKAGALVLVSGAALLVFVGAMLGWQDVAVTNQFFTYFTDVQGLNVGGEVRFGGLKVGKVAAISPNLEPDGDHSQIRVDFTVKPEIPVNEASMAYITQRTLTSDKHLEVTTGKGDAAVVTEGFIESGVGGLFGQLASVTENVQGLFEDVRALLGVEEQVEESGELEATIAGLLSGVETTITEGEGLVKDVRGVVSDSKEDVDVILDKVKEVETSAKDLVDNLNGVIAENREDIGVTIDQVRDTTERVNTLIADITTDLQGITDTLGETLANAEVLSGEARSVVEANRPVIEDLILDLRETIRNLKAFSRTMAEQPQAIIRGKELEGRR